MWKVSSYFTIDAHVLPTIYIPSRLEATLVFCPFLVCWLQPQSASLRPSPEWYDAQFRSLTTRLSGHSAKPNLHSAKALPSAALGKDYSVKNESAKTSLPSVFCRALGKAFAECPILGKVGTEKKPEKMGIFTQTMEFFFNWWRPPPVSAHPSPAFFA